jgi:hypothetical protein
LRPLRQEWQPGCDLKQLTDDDLIDLEYCAKRLFPLPAMLYPGVDTRMQFHEDHLFPRSLLVSRKKLREHRIDDEDMAAIGNCADRAANLQLLRGGENQSKSDQLRAPTDN